MSTPSWGVAFNIINYPQQARFEVLTAVKIQVEILWVVTPCNVVVGYQRFGAHAASVFRVKIQVEVFWVVTPCSVVVGYQRFGAHEASVFRVKIQVEILRL
jgi:fatty-acid desaturase